MSKIRPQILVSIIGLSLIAILGIQHGNIEVTTGCIGGITGLGFKLLENEN
jgi:hypothetical protein